MSEKEAPGYYDVVCRPMDLATIKNRVDKGVSLLAVPCHLSATLCLCTANQDNRGLPTGRSAHVSERVDVQQ